jgi:hypothetical protein
MTTNAIKTVRWINDKFPDTGAWKGRHSRAVESGLLNVNGHRGAYVGDSLIQALNAWTEYARAHLRRYESNIGDDGFLGPVWCKWGLALRGLLNGETGDLDCGTLDSIIHDNLTAQGFEEGKDW